MFPKIQPVALPEASPYSRHMPVLDGIRGLAILGVLASHLFRGTYGAGPQAFVPTLLQFGATGVDLFFVLSGFLITGILYDSLSEARYFRKFYARRALRIFPLYYAVLLLCALVALVRHLPWQGQLLSLALYLQNTSLIAPSIMANVGAHPIPLSHFWSLAVEEQFYLVWPLLIYLLRTKRALLIVCLTGIALAPVFRFVLALRAEHLLIVRAETLPHADALLAGGALALLLRSRFHDRVLRADLLLLTLGAFLVVATPLLHSLPVRPVEIVALTFAIRLSGLALLYAGLIAAALRRPWPRALLSIKPLRTLGKYSYGLYVIHLIVIDMGDSPLRLSLQPVVHSHAVAAVLSSVILAVCSMLAAVISYQLFERHFLRLKRFFDYRRHSDTVAMG